jgi:general secretion pathway protein I
MIERRTPLRSRGFSLLEVLVAFAILALSLGTLLLVFSTGLRNTALAGDYTQAVSLAESKLAEVAAQRPLAPEEAEGTADERFRWRLSVTARPPPEGLSEPVDGLRAYQLKITVSWGEGPRERRVSLRTLRLLGPPT